MKKDKKINGKTNGKKANGKKVAEKAKKILVKKAARPAPVVKEAVKETKELKPIKEIKIIKDIKEKDRPFKTGDYVVYPTHGVGKVTGIEKTTIAGFELQLFVISFDRDRMLLKVPVAKAEGSGLRRLSSRKLMDSALLTLKGRARVKRTMWSRRAQEYEAKINSGNPISIAEVVRDLHRAAGQPDQSFSERQIYEAARDRLAAELAAVEHLDVTAATEKLETLLTAV